MKIAIIGAGATGLSAAYDLTQAGHQVTVFEANSQVGGLASGFKKNTWEWTLEKYYHHWFASDTYVKELLQELQLQENLIYHQPKTAVFFQDQFYPLDSLVSILNFPGLNSREKFRFGLITAYLKYLASWQRLEKFTAHDWLQSAYGKHIYHIVWQPLLKGKFGPYYNKVNMAWMWARIKARTPKLGTYKGGFQQFFDDFHHILIKSGVIIHLNQPVKEITSTSDQKIQLVINSNQKQVFDQCLVTTSPSLFTKLLPKKSDLYRQKLKQLDSLGAVVLILSLDRPLSNEKYYWYNLPKNKDFPFLALVEHTNFVSPKKFNNKHIIYCGDYVLKDHEYFSYTKAELIKKFSPSLQRINPQFKPNWIQDSWLYTSTYAQPVPYINHSANIPSITTPIKNLFYASMSQVYPWDRGTNFAIKIGKDAARIMNNS